MNRGRVVPLDVVPDEQAALAEPNSICGNRGSAKMYL